MNHRETIALLGDYDGRRLDEASRAAVEAHLAGCEGCMELAKVYRALAAGAAADPEEHPHTEDIVAFAMKRDDLDAARRSDTESHLARCESCRREVHHVRAIESAGSSGGEARPASRLRRTGRTGWLAVAAVLLAGLLAYPAYLGLVRPQAVADRSDIEGPVDLFVLTPSERGEGGAVVVELGPGRRVVLLAFELLVPQSVPAGEALHFRLLSDAGQNRWSYKSSAGDVRAAVKNRGVLTLLVPVEDLDAGRYELKVTRDTRPDEPVATLPLDISYRR